MHGSQIGVVGLVAGVGGLPMLLGGQRVDDPDLEARLGEGTLDGAVVASRPFDDHDLIRIPACSRAERRRSIIEAKHAWVCSTSVGGRGCGRKNR